MGCAFLLEAPYLSLGKKLAENLAISVVIPVFNGAATVPSLIQMLEKISIPGGMEVILVNDGSEDDSAKVCDSLVKTSTLPITFIDLARNFGEHNAVLTGLRYARGDYVITMDDDLQQPPDEIGRLHAFALENDLDAVFGAFDERKYAPWRNFGGWLADKTSNLLLDKPHGLTLSSFRCLSQRLVKELTAYNGPYPYIEGMILKNTSHVDNLTVTHLERTIGNSNYTLRKLVRLWMHILFNFSIQPLRISMIIGLGLFGLSSLGAAYVVLDYFMGGAVAPGWASLMIVMLVFFGLQFIFLGLIGEYTGRTFMSIGALPQSSIRRIKTSGSDVSPENGPADTPDPQER